jgi:hypothetical protein
MPENYCKTSKMHKDNIGGKIKLLIGNSLNEIKELLEERRSLKLQERIKEIDDSIQSYINDINSLEINSSKIKPDEISFGKADNINNFIRSAGYKHYKRTAEQYLLKGKYVPQFLFAGGATRLGLGTMWSVNLAVIGDVILNRRNEALKNISKKQLDAHVDRLKPLTFEEINIAVKKLQKYREKFKSMHIGMGPRQILQYRLKIENLANKHGFDPAKIIANSPLIFNLNMSASAEVKHDLIKNNFYGFDPDKIFILIQPVYNAFKISDDKFTSDKNSEALPFGHGHATMQMLYNNEALKYNRKGRETLLKTNVIDELLDNGCEIIGAHRINDMLKWTDKVVSIDNLAYAIYQMKEKDKDVVVELVENPRDQKGGHWLKIKNKEFLCETLSMNTHELKKYLNSFDNMPYNAFRNMYSIFSLKNKLADKGGIKFNLRYLNGGFYLESVTGDITLELDSVAFHKKGEIIHDIKSINDYVTEGLDISSTQESNPKFIKLAEQYNCKA